MRRGGVPPRCSWCGRTEYPPANQGRGQRAGTFVLLMRFSERQTDAPMHDGPIPKDSGGRRSPQILPCIGGVPEDRADDRAGVDLAAVAAGRKPLFRYAFADPAQVAAIGEFHSLRAAARTMDGRGRDLRCIVHFAPFPGGALPKGVVVVDGSPAGVAVFAIQAAAGNQSFHHFCLFSECPPPLRDKSGGQGRLGRRHRNLFCCGAGQGRLRPLYRDDVREADRMSRANKAFARGGGFSGCGRVLGFGRATAE